MGMQINIGDHLSPQAGFITIPNKYRSMMRWARKRANWVAKNKPSADRYFKTLPNGKSLTQLLADSSIWINYHTSTTVYGYTNRVGGKEVAICKKSFLIGRWTVLATLVHELAHVNGAPGSPSKQAEEAVLHCGMGSHTEKSTGTDKAHTPYNPTISG